MILNGKPVFECTEEEENLHLRYNEDFSDYFNYIDMSRVVGLPHRVFMGVDKLEDFTTPLTEIIKEIQEDILEDPTIEGYYDLEEEL